MVHMSACMDACINACMDACMDGCMISCLHGCMKASMHVWMHQIYIFNSIDGKKSDEKFQNIFDIIKLLYVIYYICDICSRFHISKSPIFIG